MNPHHVEFHAPTQLAPDLYADKLMRLQDEITALREAASVRAAWASHVASGLRGVADTCSRLAALIDRK